ncbi:uncharacterized protein [Littorina saxatilis]|uniref:uncharacterized protein n=1 Tax=Littorina saxatilis TaxID=31220 RepID=UPI0038B672F2
MAESSCKNSSFRFSIAAIFFTTLCVTTAYVTENREEQFRPVQAVKRSPRGGFMGLSLMCQAHRRNCPGGFRKRFSNVIDSGKTVAEQQQQPEQQRFPMELPSLSELLEARREAMMLNAGNDDDRSTEIRLPGPIRSALLDALRREKELLTPRR